jgi:hypothetical protein
MSTGSMSAGSMSTRSMSTRGMSIGVMGRRGVSMSIGVLVEDLFDLLLDLLHVGCGILCGCL